jgi:hypothetical protein
MDALDKLIADLQALREKRPKAKFSRAEFSPVYEADTLYSDGSSSGHIVLTVVLEGPLNSLKMPILSDDLSKATWQGGL